MAKDSFIMYDAYNEQIEFLTEEQAGVFIKAVYAYRTGKDLPKMDGAVQMLFLIVRSQIDKDSEKYERICERNAGNILKRWGNKQDTKNTSGINGIPKIPNDTKNTDNDNDNDNDNDSEYDNNIILKEKRNNKLFHKKESFNESEIALMEETSETEEQPQKAIKSRKFVAPTLSEIKSYARERGREDLAEMFFDFFNAGNWHDSNGQPVKNWKQKFITWEQHNEPKRKTLYATPKVY